VIPLVFDVYGGMAEVTYKFLREMCVSICNNDLQLADLLFRDFRDRLAGALHSGHEEVINI
jgi:hypothetical protein